ncbi:WD40 repeat protein [Actinoplanes xinjiangensis]|uniref:WD40 repeat protein n=2 Tax=Actinoplanes xinjiangensis TaxID=512350 RepID=A0A316F2R9_9ACTN|nr:WD40 repeat protein [Actinoplanes xinjiangensis]
MTLDPVAAAMTRKSMRRFPGRTTTSIAVAGSLVMATVSPVAAAPAPGGPTSRVSVSTAGAESDGESFAPAVSGDGRYVAFWSTGSSLVAGDTNTTADVFVRDLRTRTTTRVSVATDGAQADQEASEPSISGTGRYVAFSSHATNLVPGDTNDRGDIFVRDRTAATTTRVSVTGAGAEADNTSHSPAISADGRFVVFVSYATNLVSGDTNGFEDVFVHDRRSGTTRRVSVSTAGAEADERSINPAVTADGRYVVFGSFASNLEPGGAAGIFVRDLRRNRTDLVSRTDADQPAGGNLGLDAAISAQGRYVAFYTDAADVVPGDTNNVQDIFVRDLRTGSTSRAGLSGTGLQGDDNSLAPAISGDGRFVAFESYATNLVPGDTNGFEDVFVQDRWTGSLRRVSVSGSGAEGDSVSNAAALSADGSRVAFVSYATNLVPDDGNHLVDVFAAPRR